MGYYLVLDKYHLEQLYSHAENCKPEEAVALLFGIVENSNIVVKNVALVENSARSRTTFSVEPTLQYQLLVEAENRGESLVCIFHSHPAPPRPSSKDLKNMELNPVVWLIASKESGEWESQAFVLSGKKIENVSVIISDEAL
ncbi:MAG: Mov34/MPN/PAD-1 family protein [Candidatus Thorarchaeota archaeon]